MLTRNEILLGPINRSMRILEVGPSYSPVAPKADGWNVRSIDHFSREALVEKYRGHSGVDVSRIEHVDFVWTDGNFSSAVPARDHGSFDALIASHVIEHAPDLLDFLDSMAELVNPIGVVALAIPDKRYCFDYFKPLTTTGDVMAAHAQLRTRHSRFNAFDQVAYAASVDGSIAWSQGPARGLKLVHSLAEARAYSEAISERVDAPYQDMHAWHFIPASFQLLMLELARVGLTDWQVERTTPAQGCEFLAWLRRGGIEAAGLLSPTALEESRLALLKRTLLETKDQIDFLVQGEDKSITLVPTASTDKAISNSMDEQRYTAISEFPLWASAAEHSKHFVPTAKCVHEGSDAVATEIAAMRKEIDALRQSTSWRVTAPMRALKSCIARSVRRAFQP
jgi:SAM-dependent methyltransferase